MFGEHCKRNVNHDEKCRAKGTWFAQCLCEPASPFHHHQPKNGPTFFVVPNNNVANWWDTLNDIVDAKALGIILLGITLVDTYSSTLEFPLAGPIIGQMRTV